MSRASKLYECDDELQSLFKKFNADYFQSKIKNVSVKWSNRLTSCAGCCYYTGKDDTFITMSLPLLSLRPRKDLLETLLHEMIHAYLYVVDGNKEREEHGPKFLQIMDRINTCGNFRITVSLKRKVYEPVFHAFEEEVKQLQTHWWRCTGKCRDLSPKHGVVKRSIDRAPGPSEPWFIEHRKQCKGKFLKVRSRRSSI